MSHEGQHPADESDRSGLEPVIPPERPHISPPQFVPGRGGTRLYSINALIERVVAAFSAEHGDSSAALDEATTPSQRLRLILETARYVLAVEAVSVTDAEKAQIVERAYSDLFGYGPLDPLFLDPQITTVAIKGARATAVRTGHGDLTGIGQLFDDADHLRRVITRLLADAGADFPDEVRGDSGILEVGLLVGDRPASVHVFAPPVTDELHADIRLHPSAAPTLADLTEQGMLSAEAAALIRQLAASRYGFAIVGEPETGKTTLLNAIAALLPDPAGLISVERAAELRLPPAAQRLTPVYPRGDTPPLTFGEQIFAALTHDPAVLLLDEVRADDPRSIAPLLASDQPPRQIWAVRGAPDAKRLQSALGMLARQAAIGQGERLVHALYDRLPFVLTVARIRERLQLFSIAEWQSRVDTDYPDYVMHFRYEDGQARPTGAAFARWLA